MQDIDTTSQPPTPITGSPVDVHDRQAQEASEGAKTSLEEQVGNVVKDLADIVIRQQGPPGLPSLRPKSQPATPPTDGPVDVHGQ
jgi:hypothetical protein